MSARSNLVFIYNFDKYYWKSYNQAHQGNKLNIYLEIKFSEVSVFLYFRVKDKIVFDIIFVLYSDVDY